ncbi:stage II sporulation protein M [Conexibacter sp. DBS9H8]|uniref:stage II sporulation protein M n=1 Tax=Conexibacter sp. DBS9H8 TaxID=2937801 RepID=UPI00201091DB|nr:stage II sporulation protein M [Conexibacter sp. DBS9H8]
MRSEASDTFTLGLVATRDALRDWSRTPGRVIGRWCAGASLAAGLLLVGTLIVAEVSPGTRAIDLSVPPVSTGGTGYVLTILGHNLLVLALHVFACVAGFIAGSSVPATAQCLRGLERVVHEYGGRLAIGFVALATLFSLANQVVDLGSSAAGVAHELHTSPALLLLALLPHAAPELLALFLPLAAWVLASRRGEWDQLLAAALVTTVIAVPILVAAASWETYGAPLLIRLLTGH